jgi:HK97 family phage major capsid protein
MTTAANKAVLPTEDDMRTLHDSGVHKDLRASLARTRSAKVWARMNEIMNNPDGEGGHLSASQARDYDELEAAYDELETIWGENYVDRRGVIARERDDESPYVPDQPLAKGQSFAGYVRAQGLQKGLEQLGDEPLNLTRYIRGSVTGDWRGAEAERVLMTQSGATSAAGGVLIPTVLFADLIDLARAQMRTLQAGVRQVVMESPHVDVPRWTKDPQPAFRAEGAAVAVDDATLDKVTLNAKSLSVITKITRELVEDTNVDDILKQAFAKSFALKLDSQMLYGDGTANSLTGVKNTAGVTKTPLGATGATPANWDWLVDSVGRVRDLSEEPTAVIYSDRTARTMAKLKDSTGQPVQPPSYLDGLERLVTNQVPGNMAVGGGTATTSDAFVADWTQGVLGIRTDLRITGLQELFAATEGAFALWGWWRGDFQVARPAAMDVTTGIKP